MDEETRAEFEAQLTALYGEAETEEKDARRKLLFNDDGSINPFQRIGLRKSLEQHRSSPPPPADQAPIPAPPPDLADDVPEPVPGYDDRVDLIGPVKQQVPILSAVQRWGKQQGQIRIGNRREGIHIRCPFPSHTDNNPSAWINLDKDAWFCGGCQVGGDQIDFYAAAVHGLAPDDFHPDKEEFRRILEELAVLLGIDLDPPASALASEPDPEPQPPSDPDQQFQQIIGRGFDSGPLSPLDPGSAPPSHNWRDFELPPNTHAYNWFRGNEEDMFWVPPEYFEPLLWLQLGLACGHHLQPVTHRGVTNTSFMFALLGPSGSDKTEARKRLTQMVEDLPESNWNPSSGMGIKLVNTAGSPEAFNRRLKRFEIADPQDPNVIHYQPVTALLSENEWEKFFGRASKTASSYYKQAVMEGHDFTKRHPEPELMTVDFSLTNGEHPVYDSFLSALFLTPTETLRTQVIENDMVSGFMNRIIPIFGKSRRDDDVEVPFPTHTPIYYPSWKETWTRLRSLPLCTPLPWTDDTKRFLKHDSYWSLLGEYRQTEGLGMLTRLRHQVCRFAALLAVNEVLMEVHPHHLEIALRYVRDYIQPCYSQFIQAAKATSTKDLSESALTWLHEYFDQNKEWPTWRALCGEWFWRTASEQEREVTERALRSSHRIAMVRVKGKSAGRPAHIVIATDRSDVWAAFAGVWGDRINREDLYARA